MSGDRGNAKDCDNPMRHNRIQHLGVERLRGERGRIKSDPASSARQRLAGSDQPQTSHEIGKADVTIASVVEDPEPEQVDRMIGRLDQVRDLYESTRLNRIRLMVQARKLGMSCHDIGVVMGITENAVRSAIKRAGDLD